MANVKVDLPLGQQPSFLLSLSKIEKNCEHDIDNRILRYVINSREALRLIRVIRELSPIVRCAKIYSCATEETTFEECSKALILMAKLIDNLSPDAKVLLK